MLKKLNGVLNIRTRRLWRTFFSIMIPADNVLVTGAGFGVEASIISIIGYLFVCGAVIRMKSDQT